MASNDIKAKRLAALFGLDAPKQRSKDEIAAEVELVREASAVFVYAIEPKGFIERRCMGCERPFMVNRQFITHCSIECLKSDMWDRFGLEWIMDPEFNKNRWTPQRAGVEPLIVTPDALQALTATGWVPTPELEAVTQSRLTQPLDEELAGVVQNPQLDDSLNYDLDSDVAALLDSLS